MLLQTCSNDLFVREKFSDMLKLLSLRNLYLLIDLVISPIVSSMVYLEYINLKSNLVEYSIDFKYFIASSISLLSFGLLSLVVRMRVVILLNLA